MLVGNPVENAPESLWRSYTGELLILLIFILIVATLIVLIPQFLRTHLRKAEMQHMENLKALDHGVVMPPADERARAAGRTALLVPIVVVICAGTVTCFLAVYRSDLLFAATLSVWSVAGLVSLAAITGGVALLGRLAQLQSDSEEFEEEKPQEVPPQP